MAGRKHKISHHNRILYEQTIQEKYLLPGMIVNFTYTSKDIYDRKPLLFFFEYGGKGAKLNSSNLISGINLNYLHESRVQRLFKFAQALTPVLEENLLGLQLPYVRLQLSNPRHA